MRIEESHAIIQLCRCSIAGSLIQANVTRWENLFLPFLPPINIFSNYRQQSLGALLLRFPTTTLSARLIVQRSALKNRILYTLQLMGIIH